MLIPCPYDAITGLLLVPSNLDGELETVAFLHGTTMSADGMPSEASAPDFFLALPFFYATSCIGSAYWPSIPCDAPSLRRLAVPLWPAFPAFGVGHNNQGPIRCEWMT